MKRSLLLMLVMPVLLLTVQIGCGSNGEKETTGGNKTTQGEQNENKPAEPHSHGDADALHWAKKDVKHEGFVVTLGHHGNHFHGNDSIEPAVMIVKDGKDIGEAKMTCQLFDGDKAIESAVDMVFEPKTDAEPAHYAGAKLKFPAEQKMYQIKFVMTLPEQKEKFTQSIDVKCGH